MSNAFDRRSAILDYLRSHERASTRELSTHFGVSEVTIRTDLDHLAVGGQITRQHGGAAWTAPSTPEQPFAVRRSLHMPEKTEIAHAVAQSIKPGDHLMLDASTTAYQLAWELRASRDLVVITNNVQAATLLANNPAIEVLLIGGQIRGGNWSVVGMLAQEMLAKLHARRGFFGAAGLTAERGLTDADQREVQIKRAMLAAVDEVTVLLDSSKFGQQALLTFADLTDVDEIVTDRGIPSPYIDLCRQQEVRLTIV